MKLSADLKRQNERFKSFHNMDDEIENKKFTQESVDKEVKKIILYCESENFDYREVCRLLHRNIYQIEKILGRKYLIEFPTATVTSERELM